MTSLTDREQAHLYRLLKRAQWVTPKRKPKPNTSTKEIQQILAKVPGDTIAARARSVGVSRQTWYEWLNGRNRPSEEHAATIARMTGVPLHLITGQP